MIRDLVPEPGSRWEASVLASAPLRTSEAPTMLCIWIRGSLNPITLCAPADGECPSKAVHIGVLRIMVIARIVGASCAFRGVSRSDFTRWLSCKDSPWALIRESLEKMCC